MELQVVNLERNLLMSFNGPAASTDDTVISGHKHSVYLLQTASENPTPEVNMSFQIISKKTY